MKWTGDRDLQGWRQTRGTNATWPCSGHYSFCPDSIEPESISHQPWANDEPVNMRRPFGTRSSTSIRKCNFRFRWLFVCVCGPRISVVLAGPWTGNKFKQNQFCVAKSLSPNRRELWTGLWIIELIAGHTKINKMYNGQMKNSVPEIGNCWALRNKGYSSNKLDFACIYLEIQKGLVINFHPFYLSCHYLHTS